MLYMRRRDFFPALAASAALAQTSAPKKTGRLKQCVTGGVFARGTSLEEGCKLAQSLGIVGYDLKGPADWPMLKKYGLTPTMYPPGPGGTIPDALNRKENHEKLEAAMHAAIDEAKANAVPNIITFSGNRSPRDHPAAWVLAGLPTRAPTRPDQGGAGRASGGACADGVCCTAHWVG